MRNKSFIIPVLLLTLSFMSCQKKNIDEMIPSLGEVSGTWVSMDTADMEPSIRNFRGQALLNRDMTSLSWFVSAPYSGGYHTGVLRIDNEAPMANLFRWMPHQSIRRGELNHWKLFTTTKMLPEKDAIMWKVDISNEANSARDLNLSLDLIGFIAKYGGDWQWWYPYPKLDGATTVRDEEVENVRKHIGSKQNSSEETVIELINGKPTKTNKKASWPSDNDILNSDQFKAELVDNILLITHLETGAFTTFRVLEDPDNIELANSGATVYFKTKINAGSSYNLSFLMSYGDNKEKLLESTASYAQNFDSLYNSVDGIWEEKWQQLFKPGNDLISGCFPVLETDDELARKVYYTGPLTMLYLMHTNLPQHEKVFLTGGPRWGASITFFWDITEWSTLWAVVDPEMMKEHLSSWILIDPSKHYGQDNFGGKGVGNGYSANYWALFQMIRSYVTISKDYAFLDEEIDNLTVLQHLENYALNWKKLSPYLTQGVRNESYNLADFGDDEWNLLECVPTYKHIVPSFNAGYIWMMRELAGFYRMKKEDTKASKLEQEANDMIDRLLTLYAGEGVWYSLYPDDKKIEVRHSLDFMFLGRYIPNDIPENIREEMMNFLYDELMTDHWMRAQSLKDVAAENSDRADHGPLGAFDGWPAGTMDALSRMGFADSALAFYHNIEPVTYEGCWSQAHELYGENKRNKQASVRIAQRGWHNRESSSGIAMSQVMLKCFFGFYPDAEGKVLQETASSLNGTLYHVKYGNDYYTLSAKDKKLKMKKERNSN